MRRTLSIIVPVLNEAAGLAATLQPLAGLRRAGHEVIVVDGGSTDETRAVAAPLADRVLTSTQGRARQMNAGAAQARGDVLLFLHADTRLPPDAAQLITEGLVREARLWGRFDVRLSGDRAMFRLIETLMNWRSRLTGIATGDQCLFVRREIFQAVGGYPQIALMEDIALSAALKRYGRPLSLAQRVLTSSRRWERQGLWRTVVLMWGLRLGFALGIDPARLARVYDRP